MQNVLSRVRGAYRQLTRTESGNSTTGGNTMTPRIDQMTSFAYTTYIHATPEQVWQGLTDPAVTKRYWRHQKAGAKTFRSDWKKGSTCAWRTRRSGSS